MPTSPLARSSKLRSSVLLSIPVFFLFFFATLTTSVHGQIPPVPVTAPAWARYGSKFYVLGGATTTNDVIIQRYAQMSVLDLSIPWDTNTPRWKPLSGGPDKFMFSATFSPDGKTLAAFQASSSSFAMLYNVDSDSWRPSRLIVSDPARDGLVAVGDPSTGKVYMAGGYEPTLTNMLIYDFATDSAVSQLMPAVSWRAVAYYQAIWWEQKKSVLYFGGYSTQNTSTIMLYTPSNSNWATLVVSNPMQGPPQRTDFCMAIADDGSKLVIFGGRIANGTVTAGQRSDAIYILDLKVMAWIQGPQLGRPRLYSACTIYGSTFISWGGADDIGTAPGDPVLYDLNTNRYVTRYTPPVVTTTDGPAPTSRPDITVPDAGEKKSNTGAIVGGAGVLFLGLAIAGFLFWRRRRVRNAHQESATNEAAHQSSEDNYHRPEMSAYPPQGYHEGDSYYRGDVAYGNNGEAPIPPAWPIPPKAPEPADWSSPPMGGSSASESTVTQARSPQMYRPPPQPLSLSASSSEKPIKVLYDESIDPALGGGKELAE